MDKKIVLLRVDLDNKEFTFSFQHAENILKINTKDFKLKDEKLQFKDGRITIKPDSRVNKESKPKTTDSTSD